MEHDDQLQRHAAYLHQLVEDSRRVRQLSSFEFLLWGSATVLAVALAYSLNALGRTGYAGVEWLLVMSGAAAVNVFYHRRYRRSKAAFSPDSNRIIGYLWLGLVATFLALNLVGSVTGLYGDWRFGFVVIEVLVGAAVFIMGGIYQLGAFKLLGTAQWLGGLILAFLPEALVPLAFGFFVAGGYFAAALVSHRSIARMPTRSASGEASL